MIKPVRTVDPATTPVSVADAKIHLNIDVIDDDALIATLVAAASEYLDGYTGIIGSALVTQTWQQEFPHFHNLIRLSVGPVQSITDIKYFDADNVEQTLASSVYQIQTDDIGTFVCLKPDQVWPVIYPRIDAVKITYISGFGDADAVPAPIKIAILMLTAHLYENREATTGFKVETVPMAVDALTAPYRRVSI
jgi:uncharacterized phiE125 gp8 family phage protein